MQLQDYVNDVQELVHDAIGVSWPIARVISRINDARLFTSMDMKCVRSLVTGVQLLQGQEIYQTNGAVVGCNVLAGGSNYGAGPTLPLTFVVSGGQVPTQPAQGVANVSSAGVVTSVTMTQWGTGYTKPPTVTVFGPGTGAVLQPVTLINLLYPLNVTYIFNGIRTTLRYLSFSLFQAYARILGVQFQSTPGAWTFHQQAQQVYIQPPPNQVYQAEWDCMFFTSPLVNLTDVDTQIVDPYTRAPQFAAAALLLMKDQDAGRARVGFMQRQYDMMVPKIIAGVGDIKVPNIYNRNFQRMVAR